MGDGPRKCAGKVGWAKKREAKRAIRQSVAKYRQDPETWNHYRCDHCGLLHTGHIPAWMGGTA